MSLKGIYTGIAIGIPFLFVVPSLQGCSEAHEVLAEKVNAFSFSADPSLFEPPTNERYTLRGEIVGASVKSRGIPLTQVPAYATGYITVTDSVLSDAEIVAVVDSSHRMKFELTEPVVFERQGKVSDIIVGVGTLTTDMGVFPDTRVLLAPRTSATGSTTIDATIDIPDFMSYQQDDDSLQLALTLEKSN